jgi:TubC N-terminal docking domain
MTRSPSDMPVAPADRDRQARDLVRALHLLEVTIWLDGGGLNARPKSLLSQELRDEIEELKPELIELLKTEGIEDVFTLDAEEKQHSDGRTLPRTPEEAAQQRDDADRVREAGRRRYQGGMVVINDRSNFGHYMTLLVRERERREAIERGEVPPAGRYKTGWDLFNRREYE